MKNLPKPTVTSPFTSLISSLVSGGCEDCQGTGQADGDVCQCVWDYRTRITAAGFPVRFRESDLVNLDWERYTDPRAIRGVYEYAERFEAFFDQGLGLWLYGPVGTGKTHLAVGIGKLACALGACSAFVNVPTWLEELRATFDDKQARSASADRLKHLEHAIRERERTLLILDDLGMENPTPWARDEFYRLVNCQYEQGGALVVTSNLDPNELVAGANQMRGHAAGTISRLVGTCLLVRLEAEDYRQQLKRDQLKNLSKATSGGNP
jgi:DNA replication protein DnaC